VSNKIFTQALGKALHRPTILPLPIWILKMIYGEAASVLIDSKEIYPQRLIEMGFVFHWPNIEEALEKIVNENI
jgi:NAD dependent epimerase/dehydratase family enzyme